MEFKSLPLKNVKYFATGFNYDGTDQAVCCAVGRIGNLVFEIDKRIRIEPEFR
jgi:hypothetical protein